MQVEVQDINTVGETEATIFEFINQGVTQAAVHLTNLGTNTINYRFQQLTAGTWVDLSANPDNDTYATLISGQTRLVKLDLSNPQVRLVANASGGSSIWFSVSRFVTRGDGGKLPILSF